MKADETKVLIIRFSSFGDIVQALRLPSSFKKKWPEAKVDWLVKKNFASLVNYHPNLRKVFAFQGGILALMRMLWTIKKENYDYIYDAHNNIRSNILYLGLKILSLGQNTYFIQRPKNRLKRFLLFRFHINLFPKSYFIGQNTFLDPLKKWGIESLSKGKEFYIEDSAKDFASKNINKTKKTIAVMPSAAWPLKRWPIEYWKEVLNSLRDKNYHWYFLGGKEDHFIDDIVANFDNVKNFRGTTNLQESCAVLNECDLVISNDTGLLHVADQLEKKAIAFIGPSAFGYPKSSTIEVLEIDLYCKPCSKDGSAKCINSTYQKCLKDIKPDLVTKRICEILG